jgi:ABC-type Fe3+/spermidine/putrescine transport system ATPase subunit
MLELEGLSHRYGREQAVEDVSLAVESGELVAILGPSGCGKTTVVQAVAGHVRPTSGRVWLRGEDVTGTAPERRRVSVVFQRSTLFPHMTVRENVAYGLAPLAVDRVDARVERYLDLVALDGQRGAYPSELSGGQRRRAELARALAPEPDLLVLDEPLTGLDRSLRTRLRDEIARLQRETGVTTLFVTHDQTDAMALADRLLVMRDGSVAASGPPRALYQSPPTPFVASFLGRSTTLTADVVGEDPLTLTLAGQTVQLQRTGPSERETVTCHLRPEDIGVGLPGPTDRTLTLDAEVLRVADRGRRYDVTVRTEQGSELRLEQSTAPPSPGETVTLVLPVERLTVFR